MEVLEHLVKTGIYKLKNRISDKVYIGSTSSKGGFRGRCYSHKSALRKGRHHNKHLQSAWDKYGESAFEFLIIERCLPNLCIEREQYWIDFYDSTNSKKGYNIRLIAESNSGHKFSEESKKKISESNKGKEIPEEVRAKISKTLTGRKISDDVRVKLKNRRPTDAHKRKISEKLKEFYKKHQRVISDEVRRKISVTLTGQPGRQHTEEAKAKISASKKGKKMTAEQLVEMRSAIAKRKSVITERRLKFDLFMSKIHKPARMV